jgi:tRNA G18 (ribose-2'-O)-methylase SpoU
VTPESIREPGDPRVHDFRDLRDAARRDRQGCFVAEGRTLVERLLTRSRFPIRALLMTPAAAADLALPLAGLPASARVYLADARVISGVVGFGFHRGCVALGERRPESTADELLAPPGPRAVVVLDELADPDNVGGVFRNACAFGVDAVLLSPGTADPLYRKAIRVSAGATLCLPFARPSAWAAGLRHVREHGYTLVALTPDPAAVDIGSVAQGPSRLALAVGAEGHGLGATTRAAAQLRVRIPMAAGVDSLNVATATGIALHRLRGAS